MKSQDFIKWSMGIVAAIIMFMATAWANHVENAIQRTSDEQQGCRERLVKAETILQNIEKKLDLLIESMGE